MDISQITNYHTEGRTPKDVQVDGIIIDGDSEHPHNHVQYKQYIFEGSEYVYKFGYCCENRAIQYPIFLQFDGGSFERFIIGSTGMFELQPETFKNQNDKTSQEKKIKMRITGFQAPFKDERSEVKDPERVDQGFIQKVDFAIGEPN